MCFLRHCPAIQYSENKLQGSCSWALFHKILVPRKDCLHPQYTNNYTTPSLMYSSPNDCKYVSAHKSGSSWQPSWYIMAYLRSNTVTPKGKFVQCSANDNIGPYLWTRPLLCWSRQPQQGISSAYLRCYSQPHGITRPLGNLEHQSTRPSCI